MTLFRVILTFHKALQGARQQGLSVAATFQACRGRSSLQFTGVIISLATTLVTAWVLSNSVAVSTSSFDLRWVAIQCSNLLVNAAGIILLSGASSLITSKGTPLGFLLSGVVDVPGDSASQVMVFNSLTHFPVQT